MGRRRKPTNRDLVEGILQLDHKVNTMCMTTQSLLRDFIEFMKKDKKFQTFLEKKYANTKQDKDPKKSD